MSRNLSTTQVAGLGATAIGALTLAQGRRLHHDADRRAGAERRGCAELGGNQGLATISSAR